MACGKKDPPPAPEPAPAPAPAPVPASDPVTQAAPMLPPQVPVPAVPGPSNASPLLLPQGDASVLRDENASLRAGLQALEADYASSALRHAEELQALRNALATRQADIPPVYLQESSEAAAPLPSWLQRTSTPHEDPHGSLRRRPRDKDNLDEEPAHSRQKLNNPDHLVSTDSSSASAAPVSDTAFSAPSTHVTIPSTGSPPSGGFLPTTSTAQDARHSLRLIHQSFPTKGVCQLHARMLPLFQDADMKETERMEMFLRDVAKRAEYFYGVIDSANPRAKPSAPFTRKAPGSRPSSAPAPSSTSSIKGPDLSDADRAANSKFGSVLKEPEEWSGPWYDPEPVNARLPRLQPADRVKMQRQGR
ncbi:hypothetical protein KEM56_006750 [Ascosphaera pollenicola]|nr:hypothetical protein KEM56_006750 [Ascosphaera pollenicola]